APFFLFPSFSHTATTQPSPLSLHDALPISTSSYAHPVCHQAPSTYSTNEAPNTMPSSLLGPAHSTSPHQYAWHTREPTPQTPGRSEEHTSELQSRFDLVCRLLLEKKKQLLK